MNSITIGDLNSTVQATSAVIRSEQIDQSVILLTSNIEVDTSTTHITSQVVENVGTTVDTINSVITTINTITKELVNINATIYGDESRHVMYQNTEILTTVADINTSTTTVSLILGERFNTFSGGVRFNYNFAVIDYIIEEYVLEDYIVLRNSTNLFLAPPINEVILRDGSSYLVDNKNQSAPAGFENYTLGNAGLTLGGFENTVNVDSGINSGTTIAELDLIYPTLTINDFDVRENSALIGNGDRFNLGIPSYQQPVARVASGSYSGTPSSIPISGTDEPTKYFSDAGYLFTALGSVIQYTSKTNTSFEGCTLVRGPNNSVSSNTELIPFSIV